MHVIMQHTVMTLSVCCLSRASTQIPGQGLLPLAPDGPKSPLEDSLAALHEIATMSNGGDQGQHSKRRRMSSISGGLGGRHGREDLQGPGHFVQGDIFLNGLHLVGVHMSLLQPECLHTELHRMCLCMSCVCVCAWVGGCLL